jgi:hypothetical protein
MESDEANKATTALVTFFEEMYLWNRSYWELSRGKSPDESHQMFQEALEQKRELFKRYCTTKERKFNFGSMSDPSEYDPEKEQILDIVFTGNTKAIVLTHSTSFTDERRRYVLMREAGEWRVDNMQWKSWSDPEDPAEKWERGIL